ncbi:hypothetical protein LRP88_15039 [Fusarium phalaenopsidis]
MDSLHLFISAFFFLYGIAIGFGPYRLIVLIVPAAAAIISAIVYGHAAASSNSYHWIAIVASYHLGFFAFLGANLVGITFVMDSYPNKSGPLLLVVCAGRGFVSFGLSYATVPSIESLGYDGAMNTLAIICGVLCAMGIVVYFTGKRVPSGSLSLPPSFPATPLTPPMAQMNNEMTSDTAKLIANITSWLEADDLAVRSRELKKCGHVREAVTPYAKSFELKAFLILT